MDGILNDVDDFDDFLDLPNEFPDDILLDDLDSLDFINDLDGKLIYDCEINEIAEQPVENNHRGPIYNKYSSEAVTNQNTNNYYRNLISDGIPTVFNNNKASKESGISGHTMIRELLSSDNGPRTNVQNVSFVSTERYNDTGRLHNNNNNVHNVRTHENRTIIPKHPIILPAATGTNGNLLRTPTLAATLIGIQPSSNDNMDADSSSYGSGKVVRRNSHNAIEKRYRLSINDRIDELRHMLSLGDNSKMNKSAVLRKAVERIRSLEQENTTLKCDNYNLRKTLAGTGSDESLNRTGSSPLSNQSDSGHSITNSPSSSSMNSTSVSSSYLFYKNNDNQQCFTNNLNKGVKRPLIYDNNVTSVKTEKLARLLLGNSDSYDDKYSDSQKDNHKDHSQSKRLHSSNMPSFLLCTMALFIVAFQPFDIVLNNYRTKMVTSTGGRKLLQEDPVTNGLGFTILLTLSHWLLAFILVWGSTNNRYFLTKMTSLLLNRARTMTFVAFQYNSTINDDTVEKIATKIASWRKDPETLAKQLRDYLRLYHCECPMNIVAFIVQMCAVLGGIIVNLIHLNGNKSGHNKEAHKIAMSLVTCALEESVIGSGFTLLECLWYKAVLLLHILHGQSDDQTVLAKVVMAQSISIEWIRKYFVNKTLGTVPFQANHPYDKYLCLLSSVELRKLLMKCSLKKTKEKLADNALLISTSSDTIHCYFAVFVNETIVTVIKKMLTQEVDPSCDDYSVLKNIVQSSSQILSDNDARYVNTLCNFIVSLKIGERNQNTCDMAENLLLHYNNMSANNVQYTTQYGKDTEQLILSLKLFISTIKLSNVNDNEVHEVNLTLIGRITSKPMTNVIMQLIFDTSLDGIIQSLTVGQRLQSSRYQSFYIYYADKYAVLLRDYSDHHATGSQTMVSKLNILFQSLCKLNPIKSGLPSIECKEQRQFDTHSYRVTEFLSLDGIGLREYNNSKMRSH